MKSKQSSVWLYIIAVTVVYVCLKAFGVISWSWIWIFSPIWIAIAFSLFLLFISIMAFGIAGLITHLKESK